MSERAWVQEVMERYEELENLHPITSLQTEEPPEWVYRASKPLVGVSHPELTRNSFQKWTARDLGYFLGRQSALDSVMWGEVPLSENVVAPAITSLGVYEQALGLNSNAAWQRVNKQLAPKMRKWRVTFKGFVDEVVIAARRRPHVESAAFLKAFGDASAIGDADFDERKVGVSERIAWLLVLFWRPISKFESVSQLHQFLSAAARPMGIVVTLKRVEKLCSRIGLRFKGRGRPTKKKIQTTPPPTS